MDDQTTAPEPTHFELARELSEYVNHLDGPKLLADLRCLSGTMVEAFSTRDGAMSGSALTAVIFAQALSRIDTSPERRDPQSPVVPLAEGFPSAEHCDCHDEGGGLKGRLRALLEAAQTDGYGEPDEDAIKRMVTERLKDVPGFAGVMLVDASDATTPDRHEAPPTDEGPRPGMYL